MKPPEHLREAHRVSPVTIGLDIGGSKIAGLLIDDSGDVLHEVWLEHHARGTVDVISLIAETVNELKQALPVGVQEPSIGLSIAAWLTRDRTESWAMPNLGVPRSPLRQLMTEALSSEITIENDGNATAVAEAKWGAGQGASVMALFTLGTGVGGGVTIGGELIRGAHGLAGELGHLPVQPDGLPCVCGGHGCLELYASGAALATRARERVDTTSLMFDLAEGRQDSITSHHVVEAARHGDALALELVESAGRALGRAIAGLAVAIDPGVVVLTGSVARSAGDLLSHAANAELVAVQPLSYLLPPVPIVMGLAGRFAAARGAAELAKSEQRSAT